MRSGWVYMPSENLGQGEFGVGLQIGAEEKLP